MILSFVFGDVERGSFCRSPFVGPYHGRVEGGGGGGGEEDDDEEDDDEEDDDEV